MLGEDAGHLERMHAAVGEREIDRAARSPAASARVRTALVERHPQAAPLKQDREQRTGGTRADDVTAGSLVGMSRSGR